LRVGHQGHTTGCDNGNALLPVASPGFGVRGGHDERGTEGASIEGPKGAEWGRYGEGCPLHSRLRGLGERRELPQRGPGRSPGRYHIFCIRKNWCVHQTPGGVGARAPVPHAWRRH